MSLYNLLHGECSDADKLLAILGYTRNDIPRYRDCFLYQDEDSGKRFIVIHTRTGGGNRDYYDSEESCRNCYPEYFADDTEKPTGPWNDDLRDNEHFSYDQDDNFDCTYANFYFNIPASIAGELEDIKDDVIPADKWKQLFKKMEQSPC